MNDRPSAWLAGAGLGLCVACGWGIAALTSGQAVPPGVFPLVFLMCAGGIPFLEYAARGAFAVAVTWQEFRQATREQGADPGPQAAEPDDDQPAIDDETERAWHVALTRFFTAGSKAGSFSVDALSGVVGSDTWGRLTHFYCSPEGRNILRVAPGPVGTVWGHGWQLDFLLQQLAAGNVPHPEGLVPVVEPFVASATQRKAARQSATQQVIDGEVRHSAR